MLAQLAELRSAGLEEREFCARFLLLHFSRVHGGNWLSGPRKASPPPSTHGLVHTMNLQLRPKQLEKLSGLPSAREIFAHFYFRGVVLDSHEGFVGWSEGRYPLILLNHIPSPNEMLEVQCRGQRFITLLKEDHEQLQEYGRHQDAAAFLLHDFEHAHKFFGQETFVAQKRFFNLLRRNLPFLAQWESDLRFAQDLDYLKSDMNSHPVHLLKFLKAIVLTAEIRKTGIKDPQLANFWHEFFTSWNMSESEVHAAMNLNQPQLESVKDQVRAHDFFAKEARG